MLTLGVVLPKDPLSTKAICDWVSDHIEGCPQWRDASAIAFFREATPVIGVVYHNFRVTDIEMACAITDKRALSRTALRIIFGYPLLQLGCLRVTSIVEKGKTHIERFNRQLGFRLEGEMLDSYGIGRNGLIYGMTRAECKWIRGHDG